MTTEAGAASPRFAIVTGGSRGIGKAIVQRFARAGLAVHFTYVSNRDAADGVLAELRGEGHSVSASRVDARDARAVASMVEAGLREHGRLDVLCNNAGVTADRLLPMMSDEDWSTVIDTSLNGLFGATRVAAKHMMRARSGRILNLTSVSGLTGIAGQTNYSAAKAAIIGFTRSLSKELAPWGVCVNAVAPGFVETDMLAGFSDAQRKAALERVPMRRFAGADEIAQLVAYLALDAPSFLTGQTLVIDGGMTA